MFLTKKIKLGLALVWSAAIILGCTKVDVSFSDDGLSSDPNISYIDDYTVNISTVKMDSFVTSGHKVFMIGSHYDSLFGNINSDSYTEIALPSDNPLYEKNVLYDSLMLILKPTGNYYGDTLQPFKFTIHELSDSIHNDDNTDIFFYPSRFGIKPDIIGSYSGTINPTRSKEIRIKLSDNIGNDWFDKFRKNKDEVTYQNNFRKYFKGISIQGDTNYNKTIYYFKDSSDVFIRMFYREKNAITESKHFDFKIYSSRQVNNIRYNFQNSPLKPFSLYKKEEKKSIAIANRAYLGSNLPSYIKFTFPTINSLKELHPYVKVIKAVLEIKPAKGTYNYPYSLPDTLGMYLSNDGENNIDGYLLNTAGTAAQLSGINSNEINDGRNMYQFDITGFINEALSTGYFFTKSLFLYPKITYNDAQTKRLVVNDQSITDDVKLKLYVLGL